MILTGVNMQASLTRTRRYLPLSRSLVRERLRTRQFYRYTVDFYSDFRHTDTPLQPSYPPQIPLNPIEVNTVLKGVTAPPKASKSKQKPKQKPTAVVTISDNEVEPPTKRGRPSGAGNYNDIDTKALLKYVEAELPIGIRGWKAVHSRFKKWARDHQRPDREAKSLETKFKQVGACNPTLTLLTPFH